MVVQHDFFAPPRGSRAIRTDFLSAGTSDAAKFLFRNMTDVEFLSCGAVSVEFSGDSDITNAVFDDATK